MNPLVIILGSGMGGCWGAHRIQSWAGGASLASQPLVRVGSHPLGEGHNRWLEMAALPYQLYLLLCTSDL